VRRAFLLATLALSVAIGIACPKAGYPHQLTRVSILPASTPIQMVIPAGSPTDCLGRFNPFESFSDPNGFGKFLNNCFRPDSYVRGFVDGMASCFSSAFIAPLVQIQTDLRIYVKFAAALVQGDTTTAANILQIKGERDRRNFDAFIRSIGPSLNPQVIGASAEDAGRRDGSRLCMFGIIPGIVKSMAGEPLAGSAVFSQMANRLRTTVSAEADALVSRLSNNQRGPVLTGVLDSRTGEIFFGTNEGIPTDLHPLLTRRLQKYLAETEGQTPRGKGIPGAHSEINALNRAFHARERALGRAMTEQDLSEFLLHNRSLWAGGYARQFVPEPCPNCAAIIYGVSVVE
jgi:hypothetical protein